MAVETVSACRARFSIFEQLVYVNSCSQGALSDSVRAAYDEYLAGWDERGAPWDYWVERTEAARVAFARLINAVPEEVAVTTSLSAGVASLASGIRFAGRRNKVVLTDWEFPTIGQIWHAQEARGARPTPGLSRSRSSRNTRASGKGRAFGPPRRSPPCHTSRIANSSPRASRAPSGTASPTPSSTPSATAPAAAAATPTPAVPTARI